MPIQIEITRLLTDSELEAKDYNYLIMFNRYHYVRYKDGQISVG